MESKNHSFVPQSYGAAAPGQDCLVVVMINPYSALLTNSIHTITSPTEACP